MKIPRVKIYMKISNFIKAFFKSYSKSKLNVENIIKNKLERKYVHLTGMCRTGLIIILDYLKEKDQSKNEILVCSYNLKEMIDIIRLRNFKIKFLDINVDNGIITLDDIKKYYNKNTAALLFTNMFNDYEYLNEIKYFCNSNNILLIEDSAIYYGNYSLQKNQKKYAGSIGDVSLLSFGIMKNVSALFGGAITTSDENISLFINKKLNEFKDFPKLIYIKQIILFLN